MAGRARPFFGAGWIAEIDYQCALAGFQLPASFLAERFGAKGILAIGTIVAGIGYILAGFAGGFIGLALALVVVGAGCAVQHPLSSGLVADAYRNGPRRAALGIYNLRVI